MVAPAPNRSTLSSPRKALLWCCFGRLPATPIAPDHTSPARSIAAPSSYLVCLRASERCISLEFVQRPVSTRLHHMRPRCTSLRCLQRRQYAEETDQSLPPQPEQPSEWQAVPYYARSAVQTRLAVPSVELLSAPAAQRTAHLPLPCCALLNNQRLFPCEAMQSLGGAPRMARPFAQPGCCTLPA